MTVLFILVTLLPTGPQTTTKDPLFSLPTRTRHSRETILQVTLERFWKQPLGRLLHQAYEDPKGFGRMRPLYPKDQNTLVAWGSTGDPKALSFLRLLLPQLTNKEWIVGALAGLARSQDPKAHKYLIKALPHYSSLLSQETGNILFYLALRSTRQLLPLLSNSPLGSFVGPLFARFPDPSLASELFKATQKNQLSLKNYLTFFNAIIPYISKPQREGICAQLFDLHSQSLKGAKVPGFYYTVLSHCDNTYSDPRWLVLMGDENQQLPIFKALRNRVGRLLSSTYSQPLRDLMTEYVGAAGWEQLFLTVLGRIQEKQAVRMVASYVLSRNLWLREEALTSLAQGAHPTSGRMLHAAALESAGEEAVLYFAPYFWNIRERPWASASAKPLLGILQRYIKAKSNSYMRAALFSLAYTPWGGSRVWWPWAQALAKRQLKLKRFNRLSGLVPVLSRSKKSVKLLRGWLNSPHVGLRSQAAWGLGVLRDQESLSALSRLARTLTNRVSTNATWALGRLKGSEAVLYELLNSPEPQVATNAALALLRRSSKGTIPCSKLFEKYQKGGFTPKGMGRVSVALRRECRKTVLSRFRRWMAALPGMEVMPLLNIRTFDPGVSGVARGLYLRLLSKFHIGIEGRPYRLTTQSGETLYGVTGFGGFLFHPHLPSDTTVEWLK